MRRRRPLFRGPFVVLTLALVTAPVANGQPQRPTAPLVRLPFPQDDGSLTPYTFELGYPLVTLVYDTLMWRDENGVPRPWLARAVDVSADGRQVSIRLSEGARWHDGAAVTGSDVAFTLRFVAEHPHPRFTPQLKAVEAVEAPDPSTVVISLRHPSPGFTDQPLADLPMLPAHLWQGLGKDRVAPDGLPVGSGPYRLTRYEPGTVYRFEANPDYFRGAPAVTTIEVPIIDDAEETIRALERRSVDMIPLSLPEALLQRVEGLGTRVREGPTYLGTVLMFNLRRPPFDRLETRQAVARALDLDRIVRGVGRAVAADRGYLHPDSPWSSPEVLHVHDEEASRMALARLELPPFGILAPTSDPVKLEAARQVVLALERVGARAEIRELPPDELARAVGEDGTPPSFDAAIWTAPPLPSYDPDFLRPLFGSGPDAAALNHAGYTSAAFDALADRIVTTPDPAARRSAVGEVLRLLANDLPVVPLVYSTGTFVYRPAVYDGWRFVRGAGILDKRSFVEPRPVAAADDTGSDPGGSQGVPLGLAGAVLAGAGLLMAVAAMVRRLTGR